MVGLSIDIPEMLPGEVDSDLTDKQKDFIIGLSREVGASQLADNQAFIDTLSKSQASSVLDQLLELKEVLIGESPIDPDKFEGLDEGGSADTGNSYVVFGVVAIIAVVCLIIWLSA